MDVQFEGLNDDYLGSSPGPFIGEVGDVLEACRVFQEDPLAQEGSIT